MEVTMSWKKNFESIGSYSQTLHKKRGGTSFPTQSFTFILGCQKPESEKLDKTHYDTNFTPHIWQF